MKLIREKEGDGILNYCEWWLLSNIFEVLVVYDPDIISISIMNKNTNKGITKELSGKLHLDGISLTRTIDSYFIECNIDQILKVMSALEALAKLEAKG